MSDVYAEAWAGLGHIDRDKAIIRVSRGLSSDTYVLDPRAAEGLTDHQKLALVGEGRVPFGGEVRGNTVTLHTD